jgi:hypothetical protein
MAKPTVASHNPPTTRRRPQSEGRTAIKLFSFADPVAQLSAGPLVSTTPVIDFDGIPAWQGNGYGAPDSNGAVGATEFIEVVNTFISVYDKTTAYEKTGPVRFNKLWQVFGGFGGPCQATDEPGDVLVNYDKAAGRWIFTHHASQGSGSTEQNVQCFAISAGSEVLGNFYRYAFQLSPSDNFISHSKLGIWPDAYYVATNESNPTTSAYVSGMACALDRTNMLAGTTARPAQCFDSAQVPGLAKVKEMLPSDLDGTLPPPAAAPNFFMSLGPAAIKLWQFHVDFTTPANSNFTPLPPLAVTAYQRACPSAGVCIPQLNSQEPLAAYPDRLMYRLAYRNFSDHDAIVVTHSVNPPTNGFAGVRWYEIRNLANPFTSPTIFQQGTYAPDNLSRWMASGAMDKVGDVAIGYSISDSTIYPEIGYTGRTPADPSGTLESENLIVCGDPNNSSCLGKGSQQPYDTNWGNYTSMSIDPSDDCTFWYTNEYWAVSDSNHWSTHIGAFKFSGCH